MFKNHALQVSAVKTSKTPSAPETPKVDYIEKIAVNAKLVAQAAVGAYIVVKATDTASKTLMHIVTTKIK